VQVADRFHLHVNLREAVIRMLDRDAAVQQVRQADKYQTVLFERVRYSVPRRVAFEPVTVKAYVDRVVLVHKGQVVATHRRSRTPGDQVLEPTHFLAALDRKPAYLDHTKLFKELKLPAAFAEPRDRLSKEMGERTGTRHYIRVLQLLGRHGVADVARAIEACLHRQVLRAEFVEQRLASPGQHDPSTALPALAAASAGPDAAAVPAEAPFAKAIPHVRVPAPDLRRFDALLSLSFRQEEGEDDDGSHGDAVEAQPQGTEAADDAGRACPAGA
jgi:hypothetical protein